MSARTSPKRNKYTLHPSSRTILGRLQDPAEIRVYWENVPLVADSTRRYLETLLEEMEDAGGDKLSVNWVNMSAQEGKDAAQKDGVEAFTFGAIEGDSVRQSKGFMSLAIELGEENAAVLNTLHEQRDELEYLIIAEIQKRSRLTPPVIGLVIDGMASREYSTLKQLMRRSFGKGLRTGIQLDEPIAEDVDVLVLVAPTDLTDLQVYHIEQHALRGGRVLALLDPVDIQRAEQGQRRNSGLAEWLEATGVAVDQGVTGDLERVGRFVVNQELVPYPLWPIGAPPEDSDKSDVYARTLHPVRFRWPAGLRIDEAKTTEGNRVVRTLLQTGPNGYRRSNTMGVMQAVDTPFGKVREVVPLAALIEGPLSSQWNEKPLPKKEEEGEPGDDADDGMNPFGFDTPTPEAPPPGDAPDAAGGADAGGADAGGEDATGSPDGEPAPEAPEEAPEEAPPEDAPPEDVPEKPKPEGEKGPAGPDEEEPAPATEDESEAMADEATEDEAAEEKAGEAEGEGDATEASEPEDRSNHRASGDVRMVVVGDAEMVSDFWLPGPGKNQVFLILSQFNGGPQAGFSFVLNTVDWMTGSDELLSLRARDDKPRTLEKTEEGDRKWIEWLNYLAAPLLMLLLGIVIFFVRRS